MPLAIALFIALSAVVHTDTLLRGDSAAWKGVDHQWKAHTAPEVGVEYVLTTSPWYERRADRDGGCNFSILARVNGRPPTRLILGAVEMILDDSWAAKTRIKGGETMTIDGYFLDPIGGASLAKRTTTFHCREGWASSSGFVQPDMSGIH